MLLVFTENLNPRFNYITKFIFENVIGIRFQVTTNKTEFENYSGPKISYSITKPSSGLWIIPSGLLSEKEINQVTVNSSETIWGKVFFPAPENQEIPFDFFSASFYILSRYEEYLPFEKDAHGRFPHSSSVLFKNDLLATPIINLWAKKLSDLLDLKFPEIVFDKPTYKFISTIDIDNAFAYKGKGFLRNSGGMIKSSLKFDFNGISERISVLHKNQKDPYDSYDFITEIHKKNKIEPKIFVLNGRYAKFDKNISPANPVFNKSLKQLGEICEFGIHPSYKSNFSATIEEEKSELEKTVNKTISISRQHFLMLSFPETYRRLIQHGIKEDFSMGYSQVIGFRAGTCSPFPFFDLQKNEETPLTIFPFSWMDRTLKQFLNLNPDQAIQEITKNIHKIKENGGTFVSLWHNESLGNTGYWSGWRQVFEQMMKIAIS